MSDHTDQTHIAVLERAIQYLEEIEVLTDFEISKDEDVDRPTIEYVVMIKGTRPRDLK